MSNPHKRKTTTAHWEWECDNLKISRNQGEGMQVLRKRVEEYRKSSSQLFASSPLHQAAAQSQPKLAALPPPSASSSSSSSSSSSAPPPPSAPAEKEKGKGKEQKEKAVMIPSFTNLPMTGRFAVKRNDELFFVILEKKLNHLDDFLARRWQDEAGLGRAVYLHGIQGVGKSHCLYYTAWQMSKNDKYRVAYIPDCGGITGAPFSYLLQAIEEAFSEKRHNLKGVDDTVREFIEEIRKTMGEDLDDDSCRGKSMTLLTGLLQKIDELCAAKNLRFVFIADQFNTVQDLVKECRQPFFEFQHLHKKFQNRSEMVILSGSANNEFNFKLGDFQMVDFNDVVTEWGEGEKFVTLGFTEAEFEVWATHFKAILGEEQDLTDLKSITNLIPLELSKFLEKKSGVPFADAIKTYRESRVGMMKRHHNNYLDSLSEGKKALFHRAAEALYLGEKGAVNNEIYDRQLMFFRLSSEQFCAITPLASQALLDLNQSGFQDLARTISRLLPKSEVGAVGRMFEMYLNQRWEGDRNPQIAYSSHVIGTKVESQVNLSVHSVEKFPTSDVPASLSRGIGTLVIPTLQNYPIIDYIYFSPQKELYLFQLTVQHDITKNMDNVPYLSPESYPKSGVGTWFNRQGRNMTEAWMDHFVWQGTEKYRKEKIRSAADCAKNKVHVVFIGYPADDYQNALDGLEVADITKFGDLKALAAQYKVQQD